MWSEQWEKPVMVVLMVKRMEPGVIWGDVVIGMMVWRQKAVWLMCWCWWWWWMEGMKCQEGRISWFANILPSPVPHSSALQYQYHQYQYQQQQHHPPIQARAAE